MDFEAAPSRGGLIGLGLVAAVVGLQLGLLAVVLRAGPGPLAAVLLVADVLLLPLLWRLGLWLWGYYSLTYTVSRDGIVVRWGATRHVMPMEDITHVLNGRPYAGRLAGLHWPGHEVGHTSLVTDDGAEHLTLVFATRPPAEQILILTPGLALAISPADRTAFVEEFKVRRRLGPVQRLDPSQEQPAWARWPIWRDGLALRLAWLGLGLNLFAFAWLVWQYPGLPAAVPLQLSFDTAAGVTVLGPARPRLALWLLPCIGLGGLLLNAALATVVHRRERLAALLLLLGTVLLQLALAVVLGQIL